ncbi:hypothetical protein DZK25_09475 [Wenzhouxiangella sp. 15181]|nr:hypothetical protein DZK25_09475 [Wenzhouxiangella sp. 15181]
MKTGGKFQMREGGHFETLEWEVEYRETLERGLDGNISATADILTYLINGQGFESNESIISTAWDASEDGVPSNVQLDITELPNEYRQQWFIEAFTEEARGLARTLELPNGSVKTGSTWVPPDFSIPDEIKELQDFEIESEVKGWSFVNGERVIVVETFLDAPPGSANHNLSTMGRGYTLYDPISFVPVESRFSAIMNFTRNGERVTARADQYRTSR